jgi:hypothetical protein
MKRALDPTFDYSSRSFVSDPARELDLQPAAERPRRALRALPAPMERGKVGSSPGADFQLDVLLEVEPTAYVEALTAEQVPSSGVMRCPLPGHEDRTPSFHVYGAERGWFCFGCARGGSIIDLGALVLGIEPRGPGYHEIRRRLLDALLSVAA